MSGTNGQIIMPIPASPEFFTVPCLVAFLGSILKRNIVASCCSLSNWLFTFHGLAYAFKKFCITVLPKIHFLHLGKFSITPYKAGLNIFLALIICINQPCVYLFYVCQLLVFIFNV